MSMYDDAGPRLFCHVRCFERTLGVLIQLGEDKTASCIALPKLCFFPTRKHFTQEPIAILPLVRRNSIWDGFFRLSEGWLPKEHISHCFPYAGAVSECLLDGNPAEFRTGRDGKGRL